jgi:hypothetical protein
MGPGLPRGGRSPTDGAWGDAEASARGGGKQNRPPWALCPAAGPNRRRRAAPGRSHVASQNGRPRERCYAGRAYSRSCPPVKAMVAAPLQRSAGFPPTLYARGPSPFLPVIPTRNAISQISILDSCSREPRRFPGRPPGPVGQPRAPFAAANGWSLQLNPRLPRFGPTFVPAAGDPSSRFP